MKVSSASKDIFKLRKKDLFQDTSEQLVLLENIRFYKEEEKKDMKFVKKISSFGDVFINECFSCCHRNHSSISGIPSFFHRLIHLHYSTKLLPAQHKTLA